MIEIVKWEGSHATDKDGREHVDLTSGGIFAAGLGPNNPEIKKVLAGDGHFCSYSTHYGDLRREKYLQDLKDFTGFESAALFSTGSEATEAFWRVCRVFTGKPGIWGGLVDPDEVGGKAPRCDAMHGVTLGALIMAGKMTWEELGIFPELGARRFGMAPEHTGGMIMEPYHAASGQFHKIDPTIKHVADMQRKYPDIPLCLDEIQGGFGRTGKLWAFQQYLDPLTQPAEFLLKPQFITIGKVAGGGLPLSALLGTREILESDAVKEFGHLHSTHSGNPLMCAVGSKVIEIIRRDRLIEEAVRKGDFMHGVLRQLPLRAHGKGLMAGIEFKDREECARAVKMCEERGVLVVDTGRKWIKLGPALNITDMTLLKGVKIICEVVEEIFDERTRDVETCGDSGRKPGNGGTDISGAGV